MIEIQFVDHREGEDRKPNPVIFTCGPNYKDPKADGSLMIPLAIMVSEELVHTRKLQKMDSDDLADRIVRAFEDWVENAPTMDPIPESAVLKE